eukprot:m.213362 g.213362  ORF g.213362 m.213362 type:complete len:105 (+) comp15083_c2_seq6:3001-3315(+)
MPRLSRMPHIHGHPSYKKRMRSVCTSHTTRTSRVPRRHSSSQLLYVKHMPLSHAFHHPPFSSNAFVSNNLKFLTEFVGEALRDEVRRDVCRTICNFAYGNLVLR